MIGSDGHNYFESSYKVKQPMGCEAQLAWKCLINLRFIDGDLDQESRSGWPIFDVQ